MDRDNEASADTQNRPSVDTPRHTGVSWVAAAALAVMASSLSFVALEVLLTLIGLGLGTVFPVSTVAVQNGSAIVDQAVSNAERDLGPLRKVVLEGTSGDGRAYTETMYRASQTASFIEYWVLHGAGHAWSGGFPKGSFTDASGPDASAEMVRFFLGGRPRR